MSIFSRGEENHWGSRLSDWFPRRINLQKGPEKNELCCFPRKWMTLTGRSSKATSIHKHLGYLRWTWWCQWENQRQRSAHRFLSSQAHCILFDSQPNHFYIFCYCSNWTHFSPLFCDWVIRMKNLTMSFSSPWLLFQVFCPPSLIYLILLI